MSMWFQIFSAIFKFAENNINTISPEHQSLGLVAKVLDLAGSSIGLVFTIVFSNFDMTFPVVVIGIIFILETIRFAYSSWRWAKGVVL